MAMNTQDFTKTQKGPCEIYFGLAVPAAGAELTLGTGGVPDATENPNAKRVGLTETGATVTLSKTEEDEYFDEHEEPLGNSITQVNMSIKVDAAQILDADVLAAATNGIGTQQTVTDKKKFKIGKATILNTGIAVISPQRADPSLYVVSHIYSGHNMSNIDIQFSRSTRAKMSLEFKGVGIPSRAADDRLGAIWWETA